YAAGPARMRNFRTCWLGLERKGVDVCLRDPGFDVDLVIAADAGAMARVWMGALSFAEATRSGGLSLDGPRELVRAFPSWLLLSHYAHVDRRGPARGPRPRPPPPPPRGGARPAPRRGRRRRGSTAGGRGTEGRA